MLINFFHSLRDMGIPVTTRELLDLYEGLGQHVAFGSADEFYFFSRTCLVKDEKYFDRFDKAFGAHFDELQELDDIIEALIPEDWLRSEFMKNLSEEDKAKIESLGGLEKLIEEFKKRLEEQEKRHEGGNKWIGTGGTSPFGQEGYHPEGIRVGPKGGNGKAVKVWDRRDFRNLDDSVELGTRNIKMALRRLRKFARTGAADELDLDDTIRSTARNAGLLDIRMVPERHNAVKVLLFFDVGGSMDPHVRVCEELFSASRTEFKHMENFYFHNFFYESVWQNNVRRHAERTSMMDILHKYAHDYKVIIVGDASMSPYEILQPGGSVEHWNEEPGEVWLKRVLGTYEKAVWINPIPEDEWEYTQSIAITHKMMDGRMYPLTLKGLEEAMAYLSR
ncbi:MAG: VWA domain-containing protein [Halieaceae bacterium]|nr:VWA domain-containing protein [Halieaceae bacterium]